MKMNKADKDRVKLLIANANFEEGSIEDAIELAYTIGIDLAYRLGSRVAREYRTQVMNMVVQAVC
jgi:hypothetical protein